MANRRKKKTPDDFDWQDDREALDLPGEPEVEKITLEDFCVKDKVKAFVDYYEPCDELNMDAESFDDARLREYFKAYVCGLGDPLKIYVQDLKMFGFELKTSFLTGEPTIFVRPKL